MAVIIKGLTQVQQNALLILAENDELTTFINSKLNSVGSDESVIDEDTTMTTVSWGSDKDGVDSIITFEEM